MAQASVAHAAVTPTWQNPYVEVIRYGFAHRNVGWQQHGDVEQVTDPMIQKNVFKIRGTIAATNYVRFPREVSKTNQGLGLTGRYVYVQFRRAKGRQATLHLDLLTAKKSALRFSLSSMFSSLRSTGTVLRVPLNVSETWTTLVVDMAEMLQLHGFSGYSREGYRYLKAVTCCASMNLRNVVTSSTYYSPDTMPATLALPTAHENQFGPFEWISLPAALGIRHLSHSQVDERVKPPRVEGGVKLINSEGVDREDQDGHEDQEFPMEDFAAVSPMPRPPARSVTEQSARISAEVNTTKSVDTSGTGDPPLSPTSRAAGLIRDREDVLSRADQIMRDAGFSVPSPRRRAQPQSQPEDSSINSSSTRNYAPGVVVATQGVLSPRRYLASEQSDWPDPILSLTRIIGFSAAFPKALRWIPDAPACVYTSYSTIIIREFTVVDGGQAQRNVSSLLSRQHQEVETQSGTIADSGETLTDDHELFLTGHTGEICALGVSPDGALLATAQNEPQSVLRVWDLRRGANECVIVMKSPTKSVHVLAFAKDGAALCCVGMDDHARTQIVVWNSSSLLTSPTVAGGAKKLAIRARQTCDFPIHAIAFSPYEPDQLVSCGKENVRFWRINEARHHLPGSPVILNEYSRGTVFTDIAFDCVYPQFPSNLPRVRPMYVSSSVGSILVINYDTREVVCVYKLHDAAINSICVNEGFCVTGSDDKFLRVWPIDFSDFFLEAEHEAPVNGVDVSSDGMRVAVGTSNGAVGVLHLADQRYRTVLRSHTHTVSSLAPLSDAAFVTSAADGTLRVWNTTTGTQTMEFDVSKDLVTCLTATTIALGGKPELTVAVGFQSGCTRIFSLGCATEAPAETPAVEPRVLHEFQQHQSSLRDVQYQSDGKTLYTSANGQQLCMYDVTQGYTPIKMLIAEIDGDHGKMCLSRDRRFLAVLQQGRRSVLLLDATSLCVIRVLTPPNPTHTTPSDGSGDMQELTQLVISWNSQELLTLTRADRLHVFSLTEAQPSGPVASVSFGSVIHSMPLLGQQGITSLALSPNLKYIATGGSDSSVRVWQCEFGKHKFQRMNQTFRLHAGQGAVRGLVFTSDGRRLIATSDSSSAAFVWRFRGNVSKLPALELQYEETDASLHTRRGHKGDFELPLGDVSNENEAASPSMTTQDESPKPVELGELTVSSSRVDICWKRLIPSTKHAVPQSLVWASEIGCLISTSGDGRVVVIEMLDSGQQLFLHTDDGAERLVLSPSQRMLVVLPPTHAFADVYSLDALRQENNQVENDRDGKHNGNRLASTRTRVQLPQTLDDFSAVEVSVDGALLCVSGEVARKPVLFVVDIHGSGELVWHVHCATSTPIISILSQSPREFLCAAADARKPLLRLRVPPFPLSAASLTLESAIEGSLAAQPHRLCFRDDGTTFAFGEEGYGGIQQRCRFAVSVDNEAYCYFLDLERQRKFHTMQLLLPVARAKITEIQWIGTSEWQALLVVLGDDSIAVFALPTQFSFTSTKIRVAALDWAQLTRTGRLTSASVVPFDGPGIAHVLVDPLSEACVVTTNDGAITIVNLRTGQRRGLRAAPSLHVFRDRAIAPRLALNEALVLTLSGDRRTLQCWELSLGRELARLCVPSSACVCFAVSAFEDHLVAAGYDDGSLRVFDLDTQQLVAQCVLQPTSQRLRPPSGGKSREASSPSEALSILKQKETTKRSATRFPLRSRSNDKRFQELHFIGPRCILAVASSSRVVLFDLSDIPLKPESEIKVVEGGGTNGKRRSLPKSNKSKELMIHYRDVFLPSPDRMKGVSKTQRSVLQSGRSSAVWDIDILSVDVQLLGGQSPGKAQRHRADLEDSAGRLGSTQPFLIVARMADHGRGTHAVVAHTFAGSTTPANHPVHAEDEVVPCDSWVVRGDGQPFFHPTALGSVVNVVVDDDASQWIEVRDVHVHAPVLRLAVPQAIDADSPLGSCSLMRWHTQSRSTVALVDAASPTRPRPVAIVDLIRRSLVRVDLESSERGAMVFPTTPSARRTTKSILLIDASPATGGDSGLVVAELVSAARGTKS